MIKATMYFAYGNDARPGLTAKTTFAATLSGERTSTTRFPRWPGHDRWLQAQPGDTIRFYEDRDMRGRYVDVVITEKRFIDLARCGEDEIEQWSKAEGWSKAAGRGFGRQYGAGLQVRFRKAS